MKLRLSNLTEQLDLRFIRWLTAQLREHIIRLINPKKLINWNNYLNAQPALQSIYKKKITAEEIIIAGAYNLINTSTGSEAEILINPNINMPGLDRAKVSTLCKLINFGNQEISSYPIFTDAFDYFAENISMFVNAYINGKD